MCEAFLGGDLAGAVAVPQFWAVDALPGTRHDGEAAGIGQRVVEAVLRLRRHFPVHRALERHHGEFEARREIILQLLALARFVTGRRHLLRAALSLFSSAARASSVGGASRPSAFAVLRLTTSSNLVSPTSASSRRWPARSHQANLPERNGSPRPSSRSALATRGRG